MLKATVLSLALVGSGSSFAYGQTVPEETKAAQTVPAKPAPAQSTPAQAAPKQKAPTSTADKLAADILAANTDPAPAKPAASKPAAKPAAVTATTQTAAKTDSAAKPATVPAATKTAPASAQAAAKISAPAAAPAAPKVAPAGAQAAAKTTAPAAAQSSTKTATATSVAAGPGAPKAPVKAAAKKAKPKPKTIDDMAVDGDVSYTLAALTNWINASKDNRKLPFAVVDKNSAQIAVFDATGKLKALSPILIGSAAGDTSAEGVGDRELKDIPMEDRTTPAGRFVAGYGPASGHSKVLWIDYATAISIHPVLTTAAAKYEKRTQRLASKEPDDNRITHGCINVSQTFYTNTIRSVFGKKGGVFYVIPDTISLLDAFPAYVPPGEEIIAAAEEPVAPPVAKAAAKPVAKSPAKATEKTASVKQAPAQKPAQKSTAQTATTTALE